MSETAQSPDGKNVPASPYRLSLVLPAWNEQDTIRQAIEEAQAALSVAVAEHEIIVVDDGSTDGTAEIVREEAARDPRVRLVQLGRNTGYGAALRTGFQAATLDLVAFTDADCQFDLSETSYMLPLTERYDITCGYRIDRQDPVPRRFFSWGYNTLVTLLMGSPVHDLDCALKIYRREKLATILPECDNFFANTEMLTKARMQGLSIVEVGVHHRLRLAGQSKVSLLDIPRTLSALLPFWWSRVLFPARKAAPAEVGSLWLGAGFVALLATAAALLLFNLSYPLIEPDEGRYAEIGREMVQSGNWIVPTLNGKAYFDKPPLFYWLVAGSFRLFGMTEQAARLVPALCAFLTVIVTFGFGRRILGTRGALLGAFALTLMVGFVHCGRYLILDSVLTLFVTLSLFTAHEAVRGARFRRAWWIASSICCGLGVMTKGPVALVLLAPTILAYVTLSRNRVRPRPLQWCFYGLVVLGIVAPWFIAISVREPGFLYEFFVVHHLQRFVSENFHEKPMWFYLPVLFIGCMPWTLLAFPIGRFLFSRSAQIRAVRSRSMGFFALWAVWCVLFFSLSRGKLPPYLMPALPAIAMLIGCYLEQMMFQTSLAAFFRQARDVVPQRTIPFLAAVWLAVDLAEWIRGTDKAFNVPKELLEMSFCVAAAVGVLIWGKRLPTVAAWTLCCVVGIGAVTETSQHFVPDWSGERSLLSPSNGVADMLGNADTAVATLAGSGSIPFSLDRDNARGFGNLPGDELKEFLSKYRRTVIVLPTGIGLDYLRDRLPSNMEIVDVISNGNAQFVLVRRAKEGLTVSLPNRCRTTQAALH
jgi:dolichol-phosphate mannosyltransferase